MEQLYTHICRVVFRKKDGSERVLIGTMNPDVLEQILESSSDIRGVHPEHLQLVYDLENDGWRSIIKGNLISLTPLAEASDDIYEVMRSIK